ncbi:MAG: phenylacetate--CoA ligase family protein [Candidatus Heimdallarchaeota archaeon]|nr:phenylacetate--CoA ligase family protein [Candidatus Heimdallarchaeota archaeon]
MSLDAIKSFIIEKRLQKIKNDLMDLDLDKVRKLITTTDMKLVDLGKKHNLIKSLKHCANNSPYYKESLPSLVYEANYNNVYSIIEKLPLTSSAEMSRNPDQFLAIPKSDVFGVHFTYGTTGGKKIIYNSKLDLDVINFSYAMGFINCGITKEDIAHIVYSFGIWGLASNLFNALRNLGIITLPVGNYATFQEQKEFIEKFGTTFLFGTPSYVYNLSRDIELSQTSKDRMKAIMVGGEGLPNHRRKIIEENLGGEVFMNYGLNELGGGIGSECERHNGYHMFTNTYFEIIDPKSGDLVEKEEYGELVLTSLARKAMPLIRYRTGDITRAIEGECECGLKLPMIDYLKGRADDRIIIGAAEKYYPIVFDQLLDPIKEIKDYWIEVENENEKDTMRIFVLTDKPSNALEEKIREILYSNNSIKIDVFTTKTVNEPEIIFIDQLPNKNAKRRRLVDNRKHKP